MTRIFVCKGRLTINGVTRDFEIPLAVETKDKVYKLSTEFTIDQTLWNVKYQMKTVDAIIYDKVSIHAEASGFVALEPIDKTDFQQREP